MLKHSSVLLPVTLDQADERLPKGGDNILDPSPWEVSFDLHPFSIKIHFVQEKNKTKTNVENDVLSVTLSGTSLRFASGTWRRWLKAHSFCCLSLSNTLPQGQRKPWSLLTSWLCWILKPRGLKSGWYVFLRKLLLCSASVSGLPHTSPALRLSLAARRL